MLIGNANQETWVPFLNLLLPESLLRLDSLSLKEIGLHTFKYPFQSTIS